MSDVKTFFKDAVIPTAGFEVRPTMSTPGQPTDGSAASGVSGKVTPKELPSTSDHLFHGKGE